MNARSHDAAASGRPAVKDCWNRIGVRGDKSCVELKQHLHCLSCPVYSASARSLLDAPLPPGYSSSWAEHFAQPSRLAQAAAHSSMIFRIGAEWLALPTALCSEVADTRVIHPLPHRRNGAVLGITNVRGELLVCLSLAVILGLDVSSRSEQGRRGVTAERLLVFRRGTTATVFPVDEVHGGYRHGSSDMTEVPATIRKAQATYTKAILPWGNRTVGILDEQLLFGTVDRSLA